MFNSGAADTPGASSIRFLTGTFFPRPTILKLFDSS